MGRLWSLIEQHRDVQPYPPSYRQLALKLGVSQSLFDTWKQPKRLPSRENLEAISQLTGVSYQTVLEAALEDTRYRIPPSHDTEAGEGHEDRSAPMNPAGGSPAPDGDLGNMPKDKRPPSLLSIKELAARGRLRSPEQWAARKGTPGGGPDTTSGEESQDPGSDEPA